MTDIEIEANHLIAVIIGYNVLAAKSTTLGEKLWYRLATDEFTAKLNLLGIDERLTETEEPLFVLTGGPPHIKLFPRYIELMRKAVEAYDRQ